VHDSVCRLYDIFKRFPRLYQPSGGFFETKVHFGGFVRIEGGRGKLKENFRVCAVLEEVF
jgi:hypothetical protein